MNPVKCRVMEAEVKYLVENGFAVLRVLVPGVHRLLVQNSDWTQRFSRDYRRVNAMTKPDHGGLH